jgi:hypothetical protein
VPILSNRIADWLCSLCVCMCLCVTATAGVWGPFALLSLRQGKGISTMLRYATPSSGDRSRSRSRRLADSASPQAGELHAQTVQVEMFDAASGSDSDDELDMSMLREGPLANGGGSGGGGGRRHRANKIARRALSHAPFASALGPEFDSEAGSAAVPVLVYPDLGGRLLSDLAVEWSAQCSVQSAVTGAVHCRQPPRSTLLAILRCALSVTDQLRRVHQLGVVCRSVRPQSLLFDAASGQSQLLDMAHASLLESESAGWARSGLLDVPPHMWRFMSPEQTGRVPRHVDLRSVGSTGAQQRSARTRRGRRLGAQKGERDGRPAVVRTFIVVAGLLSFRLCFYLSCCCFDFRISILWACACSPR